MEQRRQKNHDRLSSRGFFFLGIDLKITLMIYAL